MRESSQRSANLQLHLGPHKNEGIAEDEITKRIFGDYVSRYDFKRSEEDGATLRNPLISRTA